MIGSSRLITTSRRSYLYNHLPILICLKAPIQPVYVNSTATMIHKLLLALLLVLPNAQASIIAKGVIEKCVDTGTL